MGKPTARLRVAGIQAIGIVVASTFTWLAFLLIYIKTGLTDAVTVAVFSVAGVSGTLAFLRVFSARVLCAMAAAMTLSWSLLPEYSMSFTDRLQAIWNLNRIGFGGVSVMAFASMLSGTGAAIWPLIRRRSASDLSDAPEDPEAP